MDAERARFNWKTAGCSFFGQRSVRGRVPQRAVGARVEVGAVQAAKKQNHLDEAVNVSFV
jgi:hypothetical protein